MPVPKRKRSRARRDKRFANKGVQVKALATCQNCQAPRPAHQVCAACGHYKGIKIVVTKDERAATRGKIRAAQQARRTASSGNNTPDASTNE